VSAFAATTERYDAETVAQAAAIMREVVRDKSYELLPLGQEVKAYLRHKRKRLTDKSYISYESCLDKLARHFPTQRLEDFEPPNGTMMLEEFFDSRWGGSAPRTYNANMSMVSDFFKFQRMRQRMVGDPTAAIERAKKREVHRTTFSSEDSRAIVVGQTELRDRIALRLLLDYGLRKGALRVVQFKHFDHVRKKLTIFTKGGKVRNVPLPDPAFWHDLERHLLDAQAKGDDFLMCRQKTIPRAGVRRFPDKPMSDHGMHNWWYRCLEAAGVVAKGTTSGERMHKARHTAGQRLLDGTGNLKAVQKLLGHASISTTADTYTDWDDDQLAQSLASVLRSDDE
jgi:integrase/recombinase XerD